MYRKFNKKQWTDIFCPPDPPSFKPGIHWWLYRIESLLFKSKAMLLRSLHASADDGGQRVNMWINRKMSLFYFIMWIAVNTSCISHSMVRLFCGENFLSTYFRHTHWLDLREKCEGKSWGFRCGGDERGSRKGLVCSHGFNIGGQKVNQKEQTSD